MSQLQTESKIAAGTGSRPGVKMSRTDKNQYAGHDLHLIKNLENKNERNFEENKMQRQSNLRMISERWRQTFLRWMSLILSEPCMIRWESPDHFLQRHEFERTEIRESLLSPHRW